MVVSVFDIFKSIFFTSQNEWQYSDVNAERSLCVNIFSSCFTWVCEVKHRHSSLMLVKREDFPCNTFNLLRLFLEVTSVAPVCVCVF